MAELKNIRIAISGIYDYAFEELGNLGLSFSNAPDFTEKKAIYKVYRPATVLASAVDKFKMLPLTHHHPRNPVDEKNFRKLTIGFTDSNPFVDYLEDKNEVGIRATALLYDSEALDAYERGEIQLSPGYFADFEWQNGISPNGEKYDIIMKEIKDVNHLALLPNGRGGNDAVVLDSRKTIFDIVREQMQKDGAPDGNDNASKEHKKEEKSNDDWRKEIKEELKNVLHKDLPNEATGITAQLAMEGVNKMSSGVAIKKSIDNGFSAEQHFEAVKNIVNLFNKAKLVKVHNDLKHGMQGVTIKRFVAQDKMKDGTDFDALITLKESFDHGHRIYSLELDEINKASLRWQVNDDGTLSQREPTTGSPRQPQVPTNVDSAYVQNATAPSDNLSQDSLPRKTIFEIVQMNIFDQIRYGAI